MQATILQSELWWCFPNWGHAAMQIHSDCDWYLPASHWGAGEKLRAQLFTITAFGEMA